MVFGLVKSEYVKYNGYYKMGKPYLNLTEHG